MANILVSVPILDKPELKMIQSLFNAALSSKGNKIRFLFNENDSLISRVRNVHISKFINEYPEMEYFISIDSDLEIMNSHPGNNIFDKLVGHDKDFVGGLYALKKPDMILSSSVGYEDNIHWEFDSGLQKMRWLSSGCWCIKRSAVENMIQNYPELIYDGDDNMSGEKVFGLYIPMLYDFPAEEDGSNVRKYLSEDWSFCQRWLDIGGEIYADTSIILNHIGKYAYKLWNVRPVVRKRPTPPAPAPVNQ